MKRSVQTIVAVVALASSSANAATLYNEDGTQLDIYGRIAMGVTGGGPEIPSSGQQIDDSIEFVDVYSRLGFRMSQQVNDDIRAFGRLE